MQNKIQEEKARKLSEWYAKLAEENNGFTYKRVNSNDAYLTSPSLNTADLKEYIINSKSRIIDLEGAAGFGTDMEFSDSFFDPDKNDIVVGELQGYLQSPEVDNTIFLDLYSRTYVACRLREGKWQYWDGSSSCPIPEGIVVDLGLTNSDIILQVKNCQEYEWNTEPGNPQSVRAFRVSGRLPNWKYIWEK